MSDTHEKNKKFENVNNQIKAKKILIIDEAGQKIGPLSKFDALKHAEDNNFDLLEVGNFDKETVIAKMLDYGKYKYDQKRKQRESKSNQVRIENREIRLTVGIGVHDLETKARKAREFIKNGDRIKISLKFRGREVTFQKFGLDTLEKFFKYIEDIAKIESEPKLNTRFLDMYVVPKKDK